MLRLILSALIFAIAAPCFAQTPITSMRPNRWYINNQKLPTGARGVEFESSYPISGGLLPTGYDTPVPSGQLVVRPGNCNNAWQAGFGVNKSTFTGSVSGTTLTVTAKSAGTIAVGQTLYGLVALENQITAQLTGTAGGVGTYSMRSAASFSPGTAFTGLTYACARNSGNFRTVINFVKMDYADPIVYPAGPGRSHLHAFFGNTSINAWSTNDDNANTSIKLKGRSAADGGILNRSSYWVPAIIYHCPTTFVDPGCDANLDGTPIKPSFLGVYYKGYHGFGSFDNNGTDNLWPGTHDVEPLPEGFRMLTGSPASNGTVEDAVVTYECRNAIQDSDFVTGGHIPGTGTGATDACPTLSGAGTPFVKMRMSIGFPTCWNGVDLDSPSHTSHVGFYTTSPVYLGCPDGLQTQIVGVSYQLDYYFTVDGSPGGTVIQGHDPIAGRGKADMKYWRLSSDNYPDTLPAGRSGHADWFNGWRQDIMDRWVLDCIRPGIDCHDDFAGKDPTNTATPPNTFRLLQPVGRN